MNKSSSFKKAIKIGNYSYFPNQILGRGATGFVFKGIINKGNLPIAVKVIQFSEIKTALKKHLIKCEIEALFKMNHKYVIKIFQVLKDEEYFYIPMQFYSQGTLRDYIQSKKKLTAKEGIEIFHKILQGYSFIKKAGYVHRDLKTENILLNHNFDPVIIDFGYCEKAETQSKSLEYNVGSPAYMSPEAYNQSYYSEKSDIWALGVILHEMVAGSIPDMNEADVDGYFMQLSNRNYVQISSKVDDHLCKTLLLNSLIVDEEKRANCEKLQAIIKERKNSIFKKEKVPHKIYYNKNENNSTNYILSHILSPEKMVKNQKVYYENVPKNKSFVNSESDRSIQSKKSLQPSENYAKTNLLQKKKNNTKILPNQAILRKSLPGNNRSSVEIKSQTMLRSSLPGKNHSGMQFPQSQNLLRQSLPGNNRSNGEFTSQALLRQSLPTTKIEIPSTQILLRKSLGSKQSKIEIPSQAMLRSSLPNHNDQSTQIHAKSASYQAHFRPQTQFSKLRKRIINATNNASKVILQSSKNFTRQDRISTSPPPIFKYNSPKKMRRSLSDY